MNASRLVACMSFGGALAVGSFSTAKGAPAPKIEYVYVLDTDRRVGFFQFPPGFVVEKLDASGRFHQLEAVDQRRSGSHRMHLVDGVWLDEEISMPYTNISSWYPVYQLEDGELVPGRQDDGGGFKRDPGKKVIRFEDYVPGPGVMRIWNLPGYFMRRDELKKRQAWLAEHLREKPEYAKEKARLDEALRAAGKAGK